MRWGFSEPTTVAAVVGLGLAMAAGVVAPSHDTMLLLDVGERILGGARPYVDYVETNPPLSHYLHAGFAAVGRITGLGSIGGFFLVVWGLLIGASLAVGIGGRPVWGERGAARAAAAVASTALFVAAVWNLGQREHLFVLLFLPYVVHRLRVVASRGSSGWGIAAGAAAAVGVCIKPHFLLIALALELGVLYQARRRFLEPGVIAFAVAGLLYPLHFLLLPSSVTTALFTIWLPELRNGYGAYGDAIRAIRNLAPILGLTAVLAATGLSGRGRAVSGLAVVAFAVYLLQWKGWFYHLIPTVVLSSVAAAASVDAVTKVVRISVVRILAAAVVLLSVALLLSGKFVPKDAGKAASLVARISPGDRVLVISSAITPFYPWLSHRGAKLTATYPVAFPFVVLFPNGHPAPFGAPETPAETVFRADLERDLAADVDWLFLDGRSPCVNCAAGMNVPRYLRETGIFPQVPARFELVDQNAGIQLWKRTTGNGDP